MMITSNLSVLERVIYHLRSCQRDYLSNQDSCFIGSDISLHYNLFEYPPQIIRVEIIQRNFYEGFSDWRGWA